MKITFAILIGLMMPLSTVLAQTDDGIIVIPDPITTIPRPNCSNDPLSNYQVHHARIKTCNATRFLTLIEKVKIAIIDSGIDVNNPDVGSKVIQRLNYTADTTHDDYNGHGTIIASLIAGSRNNSYGGFGASLSKGTQLIAVKVFRRTGGADFATIVNALGGAINAKPDVISISIGCGGDGGCFNSAFASALVGAVNSGIFVAKSGGNGARAVLSGTEMSALSPKFGGMVVGSIAATTGALSPFSNFSTSFIDIAAPGSHGVCGEVPVSTYYSTELTRVNKMVNTKFGCPAGTSFSTPLVAAAAANIIAYYRQNGYYANVGQVENYIAPSAYTEENPPPVTSVTGKVRDGNLLDLERISTSMPDFNYMN